MPSNANVFFLIHIHYRIISAFYDNCFTGDVIDASIFPERN